MLLEEAKEILKKNGYILEAEEISIDDLIAFAKLNCSKAMGAAVTVKDRCEWPLVEIDITGDAVFKKYNGTCITGYFKERTGAGARRGASKYFSIFPEESKLVVGPGTSERVNGKLCRLITNEYTYNSWDDLIKFFNRNNFNTTKLPKTFSEAKEILEKNGYRLVEAYDAVTDRNNIKDRKQSERSYFTNLMKRLQDIMDYEGYDTDIIHNGNGLRIGEYSISLYSKDSQRKGVEDHLYPTKENGPESEEDASFSQMENKVTLKLWKDKKLFPELIDTAVFDVRNTPSMVKWILANIKR